MICAMILGAGESKRMGKPKLLLPVGEKTMIETIVETIDQSKADKIVVILGSNRSKIEKTIKNFPLKVIYNPDYQKGMLSSVQCGFQAMPEDCQAVLVVLGDQPGIQTDVVNKLIDAYTGSNKGIVLPVYKKERGHPVLIDMKYRAEVEKLSPDIGLRGVVYNYPEDVLEVEVEMPSILRDIDDEADYSRELKNRN